MLAVNIQPDNFQGIRRVVKILYEMGHRRIGLINRDTYHISYAHIIAGFLQGHRDLNLPICPNAISQNFRGLERHHLPIDIHSCTAFICSCHSDVGRLASKCSESGLRIPKEYLSGGY